MTGKPALPLVLALTLGVLAGCDRTPEPRAATPQESSPAAPEEQAVPSAPPAPGVSIAAGDEPVRRTLVLDSHLMVERNVGVVTRRDGIIESILAERGDRVKEGQPLAALESRDLQLREDAARLELEKEQSSFERSRRLLDQRIISDEEFELVRLRRDAAQKALESIQYELSKCLIRAPFDGVVSGRHVEKGQVVDIDDRRALFQVTAMSPLLARVYLPEWALFGVREGQAAEVRLASRSGTREAGSEEDAIAARVKWISDVVDPASGTAEALVEISRGSARDALRPGLSVRIHLEVLLDAGAVPLVSLPREALGDRDLDPGQVIDVEVMADDGSIQRRSIQLGIIGDSRVEVRQGLSPGDRIVLEP